MSVAEEVCGLQFQLPSGITHVPGFTFPHSFTVFDFTKKSRKSYYRPVNATAHTVNSLPSTLSPPAPSREFTSTNDKVQTNSSTGLDIEAQIANGGGIALMRQNGKTKEGNGSLSDESIEGDHAYPPNNR